MFTTRINIFLTVLMFAFASTNCTSTRGNADISDSDVSLSTNGKFKNYSRIINSDTPSYYLDSNVVKSIKERAKQAHITLANNPQNFSAFKALSYQSLLLSNPDGAIMLLHEVRAETSNDSEAYFILGVAYLMKEDSLKGLYFLNSSEQLSPTNALPLVNHAIFYLNRGNHSNALVYFNKALQVDPKNPTILTHAGVSAFYLKQFKQAEVFFTTANRVQHDNLLAQYYLGQIYCIQYKNQNKARLMFRNIVDNSNGDVLVKQRAQAAINNIDNQRDSPLRETADMDYTLLR